MSKKSIKKQLPKRPPMGKRKALIRSMFNNLRAKKTG